MHQNCFSRKCDVLSSMDAKKRPLLTWNSAQGEVAVIRYCTKIGILQKGVLQYSFFTTFSQSLKTTNHKVQI